MRRVLGASVAAGLRAGDASLHACGMPTWLLLQVSPPLARARPPARCLRACMRVCVRAGGWAGKIAEGAGGGGGRGDKWVQVPEWTWPPDHASAVTAGAPEGAAVQSQAGETCRGVRRVQALRKAAASSQEWRNGGHLAAAGLAVAPAAEVRQLPRPPQRP